MYRLGLSIILIFLGLLAAAPVVAQGEGPIMTISPPQGPAGTQIYVSITGFLKEAPVEISFKNKDNVVKTVTTDEYGDCTTTFIVYTYPAGRYRVWATDGTNELCDFFTLEPEIELDMTISPPQGPVGTQVYVSIIGFLEEEPVEISFKNKDNVVKTVTTDEYGDCTTTFIVNTYPAGRYRVWATDGTNELCDFFTLEPEIELDMTSGWVGDSVVVKGNGFAAEKPVTVYFDDAKIATGETDEDGTFVNIIFTIPESSKGIHTVKVEDSEANYEASSVITKQKVITAPTSGAAGSEVSICGTGFEADGDIIVYFGNEDITGAPTDEKGSFSTSFHVPACNNGTYTIKVSDGTNRYYTDFTVTAGIALTPTTGNVGTHLTVQGTGFRVGIPAIVTYDGVETGSATVSPEGSFSVTFSVPVSRSGEHTITASDGANIIEGKFTMESSPPPVPELLLPAEASETAESIYFDWGNVNDPSGVTYTLMIASDANLSDVLLIREGLTDSEYTLSEEERLPASGEKPYYWRVRAVDGASNIGEWSSTGSFYVGFSFALAMPDWTKYSLMGLGLVLLCFLCFWLGNRLKNP